ncbi:hypothetical protein C4J98_1992 [Pseudomonas orientalis]|jgi:hypothetical protein|uniref:hypothetical protein n=1 Tax=Pseudomonas fluorescens group TaxID=136843 RepID=UPI000CA22E6A|nr:MULTISPECIES: hypothetical protein [Pseudomonas fluorescens group]AUM70592.1 hypothetical protein C0J56_18105 [Pseudomonas fluorescens]AZE83405.1 hypothetical protein C4J98_1992 [Pseudomonas orientalis]NMZ50364.1 hypothetical protein [Pseudomonas poae]
MQITHQTVQDALQAALGRSVTVEPHVPLIETRLKINSLTMLALFAQLERVSQVTVAQKDAVGLYGCSIDQIVQWFAQREQ